MMKNVVAFLGSVFAIALITGLTRWLITAKGPADPEARGTTFIYRIKWQWRALGLAGFVFFAFLGIPDLFHSQSLSNKVVSVFFLLLALLALWLGTGSVVADDKGISKKELVRTISLCWDEIRDIRLLKNDGGAIELRGGGKRLIVDTRFEARNHLLSHIEDRTQIQAEREGGAKL